MTLASGEVIACDLIVAADGVKSMAREVVLEAWEAEQAKAQSKESSRTSDGEFSGKCFSFHIFGSQKSMTLKPSPSQNRPRNQAENSGKQSQPATQPTAPLSQPPNYSKIQI